MGPIRFCRRVYIVETNRCYSSGAIPGLQLKYTWVEGKFGLDSTVAAAVYADLTKSADSRYSLPMERKREAPLGQPNSGKNGGKNGSERYRRKEDGEL